MKNFSLLLVLLLSCLWQQAAAQDRAISGRVTDRSNGQGLPGVTVLAKGTTLGTSTNVDGAFSLSVPATVQTLTFSFVGYTSIDQLIGTSTTISVALAPDAKQLGEVVVTGALGIQRQQQQVGYATASLNTQEITQARPTNVVNGLAGKVSGLQIQTLSNGVNPTPRVTLRGNRSITGNNEALIVLDGVISTNEVLGALNPDDIADITVLKGANAAALYGSQAANGALIITTKRGGNTPRITLSQTSQFESIAFLPKFQTEFGPGSPDFYNTLIGQGRAVFKPDNTPDTRYGYQYQSFENQQYGPRFDGSMRPFGKRLPDGRVQMLTYEARPDEKTKFFNNGYQMQNGISFSGGDDKSKFFVSYQNVKNNGIVPKDKFDRNTFRLNASRNFGRFDMGFSASYSQQAADVTSNLDQSTSVYWQVFNTTVMAPLTSYQDYVNNPFAEQNYGYYNAYYYNPYFIIDANRLNDRRNTVQGNLDLSYKVRDWASLHYRIGTTNTSQASLTTQQQFALAPDSPKSIASFTGYVQDLTSTLNRLNSDLFLSIDKTFGDVSVQAILGNNVQQVDSRYSFVASNALAIPVVGNSYNLSNRLGQLTGFNERAQTRLYSFYTDVTLGYKNFFYLHGSGRYDNISILEPAFRSYFFPGVDASLVFTNLIPSLKESSFLDYGKLRGGISKVSQPNLSTPSGIGVYSDNGAYRLQSTYSPGQGFPFGSIPSYLANGGLVKSGLLPEQTISTEAGIELSFLKRHVSAAATYYKQNSTAQTVRNTISAASGYNSLLLNAGEIQNEGVEADLNITPIRQDDGLVVTFGGNFTYNESRVVSLSEGLPQLQLPGSGDQTGNAGIYAIPGRPFPALLGTDYSRTPDGKVIMTKVVDQVDDKQVRYVPLRDPTLQYLGNTQPKFRYGFNTNISYKGFTIAGQGELRTGYVVYNGIGSDLDFTGGGIRSVQYGRKDFVYPNSVVPGPNGTFVDNSGSNAVITPGGSEFWANNPDWNRNIASNYVTSGRFFKIRELSIGYAIPPSMLSKIGVIKGASLIFFGRNIFTWVPKENIYTDPEFSGTAIGSNATGINSFLQTPPTKFYGGTFNVTF